jgi:hypothetical protein
MADAFVTIVPREGAKPRAFRLDDESDRGSEMIKTFRRQAARGEIASVDVKPAVFSEPPAKPVAKVAKKAAPAAVEPAEQ